jgi:hypothetical protein
VGALGLTLTAATRVCIFDPAWNPAVDSQAVDRAYRVGQQQDVVTYRLITCGTVEERMYRLQLFKGGLTSSVMGARTGRGAGGGGGSSALRFMSREDLSHLFRLGATDVSETQRLIDDVVAPPPPRSRAIAAHLAALAAPPHAGASVGLSHHDHLFALEPEEAEAMQARLRSQADVERGRKARRTSKAPRVRRQRVEEEDNDDDNNKPCGDDGDDAAAEEVADVAEAPRADESVIDLLDLDDDPPKVSGGEAEAVDDAPFEVCDESADEPLTPLSPAELLGQRRPQDARRSTGVFLSPKESLEDADYADFLAMKAALDAGLSLDAFEGI